MKNIILVTLSLWAFTTVAQTKPKPSVTLSDTQTDRLLFGIDSVSAIISRSDMAKIDRNYSVDKLIEMRVFLLTLFRQQNVVKQDTVKTKK